MNQLRSVVATTSSVSGCREIEMVSSKAAIADSDVPCQGVEVHMIGLDRCFCLMTNTFRSFLLSMSGGPMTTKTSLSYQPSSTWVVWEVVYFPSAAWMLGLSRPGEAISSCTMASVHCCVIAWGQTLEGKPFATAGCLPA